MQSCWVSLQPPVGGGLCAPCVSGQLHLCFITFAVSMNDFAVMSGFAAMGGFAVMGGFAAIGDLAVILCWLGCRWLFTHAGRLF